MTLRTVAALALMALPACAPHGEMTELRISSDFSADEIEIIATAADEWCAVSVDSCLPVSVVDRGANVVKLRTLPKDWTPGKCAAYAERGVRLEFSALCPMYLPRALHEIGHALQMERGHLDESGVIMSGVAMPHLECLTDRDAEYICDARGCSEWAGTCPSGDARDAM